MEFLSFLDKLLTSASLVVLLAYLGLLLLDGSGLRINPNSVSHAQKKTQILRHGHCYKCLVINAVKDWLNTVDSDRQ